VPPPGFRQPAAPGPQGLAHPSQTEATSVFNAWPPPAYAQPTQTTCATIFFKTNESQISGADDLTTLDTVARILRYLEYAVHDFTCVCQGYADIRGSETYNMTLSLDRANSVKRALDNWLPPPKGATPWVSVEGFGRVLNKDSRYWAEARRVDIVVVRDPTRLRTVGLAFERISGTAIEDVFWQALTKIEVGRGGNVIAWARDELEATYQESLDRGHGAIFGRLNLTLADFVEDVRSKVTAYVRIREEFQQHRDTRHVSAQVVDAVTGVVMFGGSVEAPARLDTKDTSYLAGVSPEGQEVWRRVGPGQQIPPGARVETRTGVSRDLTTLAAELYGKLRFVHPTITARVAQAVGARGTAP
jgi:outer membrane protein OmpA-like peptidoglycan-associated protein